ncbi:oxidoreductase NAD-binding domain-containing protein 1 [Neoarius graeffei]|uniref:oxidoreductase NAD-binding domain-containing protein 1 n=1 Tax=Neoarius graeffei TaxID=443677 RepID=UPI00298CA504|nr:oxidoreductase NAD-binding domain-containing protein 1 [Neoarius graeffei]
MPGAVLLSARGGVEAARALRVPASLRWSWRNLSSGQTDHLVRTARVSRQKTMFSARVCAITDESDTVKRLQLEVPHPDFSFRAGQWVDFFIPGVEKVGGFSVCSSPGLLHRERIIELAVKYTRHPPAHWIHTECTLGSHVEVRVGGDFYFDPLPSDHAVDLLLVAGGVGINPLHSILTHAADLLRVPRTYTPGHTHLCYSAKDTKELLFKNRIIGVCQEFPEKFSCSFHVTRQDSEIEPELQSYTTSGRISQEVLRPHLNSGRTLCYLCGPPPMIESLSQDLQSLGLSMNRILYEKWW